MTNLQLSKGILLVHSISSLEQALQNEQEEAIETRLKMALKEAEKQLIKITGKKHYQTDVSVDIIMRELNKATKKQKA